MAACETDCRASPPDDAQVAPPRRKILIALDEGDESISALSWALDHLIVSRSNDGTHSSDLLLLFHVQMHPQFFVAPAGPALYTTPEILESMRNHQEHISKKVLHLAKVICDERQIDTETIVALGDPREAICEAVEKLHSDFLVIGSHGYGAFKRAFLGSVSDYCAHNAKCPVVIVKKP